MPPQLSRRPRPVTPLGILTELLDDLVGRATAGASDQAFVDDLQRAHALAAGIDDYVERCTSPESPALAELARRTRAENWDARSPDEPFVEQEMLSGHVEGRLLAMLVHATRARRVLEIGMFTGYSALAMAEALPADGEVVALELDASVAAFAQRCFDASPAGRRIDVHVGPALETLCSLAASGDRFDLVFIDADKPNYIAYLDALLESDLLAPGTLVCVDNTLMQGLPWGAGPATVNSAAIAAFNERVSADPRLEQVLVPVRDGLTIIRRVG
ncbi:MAG: O-methyltransferase [Jatrophihabitans sp.]|uniref:O-methyltransferase n=1 Tax=Jatrophihabitans sp. TaxID=1932789 RepID=UPI003F7EEF00